ncbi:putative protein, contains kelch repeat [Salvia divinorum]|uniref:Attractin/MKLN-like beta-propeller domain-containing protein n=1 Tax=Salvia divinorum TaxID=28513 RepID=A0ABD1FJM3_SALDI
MASPPESVEMSWEKVSVGGVCRWGHTCNAVADGKLLYIFGGHDGEGARTNRVSVFDTVNMVWSEPEMNGTPPTPRDGHSCISIGDDLFVFGGMDETGPVNDLHILETFTNTWVVPTVTGDMPEPRDGQCAAFIGKKFFSFGGISEFEDRDDDLNVLSYTFDFWTWELVLTTGPIPTTKFGHTCTAWENKIIVVGGRDASGTCISDIYMLDTDDYVWTEYTTDEIFPPRSGHTSICFEDRLFIFGGFPNDQSMSNDLYMLDLETGALTEVTSTGDCPSARYSVAGACVDPQMRGVLVFLGGYRDNHGVLDDMYYLHTALTRSPRSPRASETQLAPADDAGDT